MFEGEGISFRCTFDYVSAAQWVELTEELRSVCLWEGPDVIRWALEPSGRFSVASLYRKLAQGATVLHSKDLWSARFPLKIKIFLWQLALDHLPSSTQLAKRTAHLDGTCALCGELEDAPHISSLVP